jgi:DNA polymerase-3 subunit gamma/tau
MTALRKNRVNHAYLFSGPRGCGKTTSARILARCLNCAQGPTDTPCGTCPSCVELARGGSGSLDVIEIDAASHGGVDDARDLRERATYAPVRDRYKIFIIDEAHMVTSAGFNALLKIVEEPPEHIKFIFATTEPDKVIGTIRSRTHHYPFRLVPPEPLMSYLELLCKQENVPVAPGVLSLVIRAGGGSVRDSLSVLDQLMAGAGPSGLDYELAVALLGYTHASLLDDVVEAVAASDAATVFRAVDRVIQTGHDPRRFVEDLLERFRDLIIVQAMPESAQAILRGMPADQIARLQNQAHNLGAAELSRAADVTNTALTEMTGATSPRLQLELLCARILLPSSEQTERGIAARIDRVERRLNYAGNDAGISPAAPPGTTVPAAAVPAPAVPATSAPAAEASPSRQPQPGQSQSPQALHGADPRQPLTPPRVSTADWPVDEAGAAHSAPAPGKETRPTHAPAPELASPKTTASPKPAPSPGPAAPGPAAPGPAAPAVPAQVPAPAAEPAAATVASANPSPGIPRAAGDVEVLRRAWPEILQALSKIKRSTWALVEPNAQVGAFDGQVLTLSFTTTGLAGAFGRADHSDNLRQAIHKTVGIDCQITAVAGGANSAASSEPNPKVPVSREVPATSADVAWGLAPASDPVATDAVAREERAKEGSAEPAESVAGPGQRSAPGSGQEKTQPAESNRIEPEPPAEEAPPAPDSPDTADAPGTDLGTADKYAYSDDDWGPARDEDAPPLDEEPPMDWDPSAPVEPRRTAAAAGSGAGAAPQAKKPASGPARAAAPAGPPAPPATAAPEPGTAHDPWTRAVEQAPGVWVIGSESNVEKKATAPSPYDAVSPAAPPPAYEPAAAQVPTSAPVKKPEPDPGADWGLPATPATRPAPEPFTPVSPSTTEPAASERVQEPVYAMAMAASAPQAAPPQPAPATSPSAAAARQSLYQRLSNSPEAEAGRAKAPARAVAASATYVQDIPSADDETIEESGVFGRAAVERILGGKLIEERSLDGSPLPPRY